MIVGTNASTATSEDRDLWTVRGLLVRHKLLALGVGAAVVLMLGMILMAVFGSRAGAVSDSTTCTEWGSANQARQIAYGRLYIKEHGPLRGGSRSPASVIAAINNGCVQAYGDDVSDSVTVVQAIKGNF